MISSLERVTQFLYREARYLDERDWVAWEALWTDDGVYWVPAGDGDPDMKMSVIHDNRSRISTRVEQLETGKRWAQAPPSSLSRLVSNVELLDEVDGDLLVGSAFLLAESREEGTELWAGRVTHRLRPAGEDLRLAAKTVRLVNRGQVLPTLSFLI